MEKIRCLCGSTLPTDSMIKCEDPRCNVRQHIACVLIPEKAMEGVIPNPPDIFYCEICRLNRADPFWATVAHPLYPVKLNITNVPTDGSNPSQSIEKTFQITRADRYSLSKQEYDVQAWCMLLNDKVTFRMQWPQHADLQINGVPVRAINRPGSDLLGANGRDDGAVITALTRDGINKIFVGGCDARIFCVGVRIVERRMLQQSAYGTLSYIFSTVRIWGNYVYCPSAVTQEFVWKVLNMIPEEAEGEPFEDALARVRRCVGGGATTENADSDSDIEVVADFIPVNLRCPMSGSRMKVAGRFKPCVHMGCFDLGVFVEMNQRSRKWQCPICLKNYCLEKIIIDPYFNRIASKMQNCDEDVAEIEVKADGSWRAEEGGHRDLGELGLWQSKPRLEPTKSIKQEVGSAGGLRLGIRKNQNKPNEMLGISSPGQNIIPISSSGRDCEDASVNQDGSLDFSTVNGPAPAVDPEVIVLSDSEEDIEPRWSSASGWSSETRHRLNILFPFNPVF